MQQIFTDRFGFKYVLNEKDDIKFYTGRRSVTDAINIISYILRKKSVGLCIDLGANQGAVTLAMWARTKNTIFSVEADPYNIEKLKQNLALNNFPTDCICQALISNNLEPTDFHIYNQANGWQSIYDSHPDYSEGMKTISLEPVSLRKFMKEKNIDSIDILKIDIEGAEYDALTSIKDILEQHKINELIVEIHDSILQYTPYTSKDIINILLEFDYKLYTLDINGRMKPFHNSIEKKETDILAIRKEIAPSISRLFVDRVFGIFGK